MVIKALLSCPKVHGEHWSYCNKATHPCRQVKQNSHKWSPLETNNWITKVKLFFTFRKCKCSFWQRSDLTKKNWYNSLIPYRPNCWRRPTDDREISLNFSCRKWSWYVRSKIGDTLWSQFCSWAIWLSVYWMELKYKLICLYGR